MDRCALFVDAGYVLADGAMAVHGTRRRESVSWDYAGLLQLLAGLAMERSRLPLLRCYWYDSTVEGRRSAEHDELADLPGVKLRVAKMRPGRREGVEGEIHRDLTTLARNKAVSDAVVVSAEEDLAQVIADVQDMGMRVTLVSLVVDGNPAIPRALRQECDDIVDVDAAHLRPYVELISGAEPPRPDERDGALLALRPAVNGNGNGHGPSAGRSAAYAQVPAAPAAEQVAQPIHAVQPVQPVQPQDDEESRREPAAVLDYAESGEQTASGYGPVGGYPQPVDYNEPLDYGQPLDYGPAAVDFAMASADTIPPFTQEQTTLRPEFIPQPEPPARQEFAAPPGIYAAPVGLPVPGDDVQAEAVPARGRSDADLSGYNPGAVREQYQPDQGREPLAPDADRYHPVPVPASAASGTAQVRRLPTRSTAPSGAGPSGLLPGGQQSPGQQGLNQQGLNQQGLNQQGLAQPSPAQLPVPSNYGGPRPVMSGPDPVPGPSLTASGPHGLPASPAPIPPSAQLGFAGPADAGLAPQSGVSLADAVQSAHEEGQEFGDSVARDAPALWLEAVIARKPRMPSDLEARLLQGSALPIDFLLHDEVRHALRRGFWDALERARR